MRHRLKVGIFLIGIAIFTVLSFPLITKGFWMKSISDAEAKWKTSHLSSYQLKGQANWGWHEHTFQITVVDGQIVDAKCELGYDELVGESWCKTQFVASTHLIPALYDTAREMLEFGIRISPRGNCFEAEFDQSNGAPKWLRMDCDDADDEQVEWKITVSPEVP